MVRLTPMNAEEFAPYLENLVRTYAEENARAGRWSQADALAESRKEIERLLPAGRETPNHSFFQIASDPAGERVGDLWLAIEPRGGFVYDLNVYEPFRRKGYAEQAMRLAEGVARDRGASKISLHVFAENRGARKLYVKLGYSETNVMMSKPLAP
ncbi:MAG: GNAT family N-acetyltransferase [Thermoplasmata archaeon]|nr:GNAT family N-acetyltransferase [Thermoplasmata archaeon]